MLSYELYPSLLITFFFPEGCICFHGDYPGRFIIDVSTVVNQLQILLFFGYAMLDAFPFLEFSAFLIVPGVSRQHRP